MGRLQGASAKAALQDAAVGKTAVAQARAVALPGWVVAATEGVDCWAAAGAALARLQEQPEERAAAAGKEAVREQEVAAARAVAAAMAMLDSWEEGV